MNSLEKSHEFLSITSDKECLRDCDVYIVCVPTPVGEHNEIDISYIKSAAESVGDYIQSGNLFVLESTVYPGTTRDVCGAIIEKKTDLRVSVDFFLGYSSERLSPGSDQSSISAIQKVISGSCGLSKVMMKDLYQPIIDAGLHLCDSMEIAEASKLLENIQRDVNIALFNEFGDVCAAYGVEFEKVIEAASTKWNFHKYSRGLVGGHCISVDPYYFMAYASNRGHNLDVISAARRVNSAGPQKSFYKICNEIDKLDLVEPRILFLGVTYKENVQDIRNSGSLKVISRLTDRFNSVVVCDPLLQESPELSRSTKFSSELGNLSLDDFDVLIIGTAHQVIIDWIGRQGIPQKMFIEKRVLPLTLTTNSQLEGYKICL